MRKIACGMVAAALCVTMAMRADAASRTDKAIEAAAAKAMSALDPARLGEIESVAVLPLWADKGGHAEDMVKAALTQRGVKVLARSVREWGLLLGEIEWNVKREDVMDAATIQRFGKIQGCDAVLYGTVREVSVQETPIGQRGIARLSVHIADVETGQIVWSSGPVEGEFLDKRGFVERVLMLPTVWIAAGVLALIAGAVAVIKRSARPR